MEERPYTPSEVVKEDEEHKMVSPREQGFNNFIEDRKAWWERSKAEKTPEDEVEAFRQLVAAKAIKAQAIADKVFSATGENDFSIWTGQLFVTEDPMSNDTAVALLTGERNAGRELLGKDPIDYDPRTDPNQELVKRKWQQIQKTLAYMSQASQNAVIEESLSHKDRK